MSKDATKPVFLIVSLFCVLVFYVSIDQYLNAFVVVYLDFVLS